jgi:hypothetical protein
LAETSGGTTVIREKFASTSSVISAWLCSIFRAALETFIWSVETLTRSVVKRLSKFGWYWHRLHAMTPREVLLRLQKKAHQRADRRFNAPPVVLDKIGLFPRLPDKHLAPKDLLSAIVQDADDILCGNWKAFGHLPLKMSDPPRWQADNLIGKNLQSSGFAFTLDHRAQPGGADIKVIWEPNRWSQLVRLAMAAWLLDHGSAREKCIEWLHHWASSNPPFTGLNWTSGLETGIRLIQFTWIDALLAAAGVPNKTLQELRGSILPSHTWYTWRYKSFGSSANNHLIGELAGLIVAQARWPELAKISAPLREIGELMEREILAQFAEDGGNQEQALGYHLFSWEFCFQSQQALDLAGAPLSQRAKDRLLAAARFYRDLKLERDPWDFGDSDNAWVTPLFTDETEAAREWWQWFSGRDRAIEYWWGRLESGAAEQGRWQLFANSGYAILKTNDWFVRFDFSPLGYLSMAPHGHLDALHVSVSFRGQPMIIDPGTGAYYADKSVRNYLAGWSAHNSPQLKEQPTEYPKRFGTFLWGEHHKVPKFQLENSHSIRAGIDLPYGKAERTVIFSPDKNTITIRDRFTQTHTRQAVITRWKFAPEHRIERFPGNEFRVGGLKLSAPGWKMARTYNPPEELRGRVQPTATALGNIPLESLVSPAFRAVASASYLALESDEAGPFDLLISPA